MGDGLPFHDFQSVFRSGLDDPALGNAVMLSLVFASANSSITPEGLRYRGQTLYFIRQKMANRAEAAAMSTIGAILLLAGVEVR